MRCSRALLNVNRMACLKVQNLAQHTSSFTLKHIFKDYGLLRNVYIPKNHLTKEHYGFAFIHFYNKYDAKDAVHSLNGLLLDGCKLKVQMVYNDDPHYAQPGYSQGRQYHYIEENHNLQREYKRRHFSNTGIQTRYQRISSQDHSEFKSQSYNRFPRRWSSTRSKTQYSVSTQWLPNRAFLKSRNLGRGRQYHYIEENHDHQREYKRQHFSNTRIQTRYHRRSFQDHSEFKSQSHNRLHRRLSSTRSKTQSSVSTQQLPNRAFSKSRNLPGQKEKPKPKSSYKSAYKYPSGGGRHK